MGGGEGFVLLTVNGGMQQSTWPGVHCYDCRENNNLEQNWRTAMQK